MNVKQLDDYLKAKFPNGNVAIAAHETNRIENQIRARLLKLKLDPMVIFEVIKAKSKFHK